MQLQNLTQPRKIGRDLKREGFVMTDKKAHEQWARFTLKKPTASAVLHYMCALMLDQNALVIAQSTLAKKLGVSVRTISTAIADLTADQWVQVVRIGKGKECAYVINDRVAWDKPRNQLCLSLFSASVVADADDQTALTLDGGELKRIPVMFSGERQLPSGQGEDPPSQPTLHGVDEPDLPALKG